MFSSFNTARKAAWLNLMLLQCVSDRKDSQMLLRSIRESKKEGFPKVRVQIALESTFSLLTLAVV